MCVLFSELVFVGQSKVKEMSYPGVVQFNAQRNTLFTAKRPRLLRTDSNNDTNSNSTILGESTIVTQSIVDSVAVGRTIAANPTQDHSLTVNNSCILGNLTNTDTTINIQSSVILGTPGAGLFNNQEMSNCAFVSNADSESLEYSWKPTYTVDSVADTSERKVADDDENRPINVVILGNSTTKRVVLMGSRQIEFDTTTGALLSTPVFQQHQEFLFSTNDVADPRIPSSLYGTPQSTNTIDHLQLEMYPSNDAGKKRMKVVPGIYAQFPLDINLPALNTDQQIPIYIQSNLITLQFKTGPGTEVNEYTVVNFAGLDIMRLTDKNSNVVLNIRSRDTAVQVYKAMYRLRVVVTIGENIVYGYLQFPTIYPAVLNDNKELLNADPFTVYTRVVITNNGGATNETNNTLTSWRRDQSNGHIVMSSPIIVNNINNVVQLTFMPLFLTPLIVLPVDFTPLAIPCSIRTQDYYECHATLERATGVTANNYVGFPIIRLQWGLPQNGFQDVGRFTLTFPIPSTTVAD